MLAEYPDRRFQFWFYRVSHGELLIRSAKEAPGTRNIDVMFVAVEYVDLPRVFDGLAIVPAAPADVARAEERVGHALDPARVVVLVTEGRRHYVIAAGCMVQENDLDLFELPFSDGPCSTSA